MTSPFLSENEYKEINVAYYSPIGPRDVQIIHNIAENAIKARLGRKINIHIVGEGYRQWTIDFTKFAPHVRFVYTGRLNEDNAASYLKAKADIVVAQRNYAAFAASVGLPVAVPAIRGQSITYNWIFEIKRKEFRAILNDIYTYNKKESISLECLNYYEANNATLVYEDKPAVKEEIKKKGLKELLVKLIARYKNHLKKRAFLKVQRSYKRKVRAIRKKYREEGKIKVGFIVLFKSVFPTRPVFEKMMSDPCFDPYIIVAPNVSRTMRYQRNLFMDTYTSLRESYGDRVIAGYDVEQNRYLELKDEYSILFFCNPYKHLVHPYHEIEYFLKKNTLPIYASYGFAALAFWNEVIATDFYSYLWKACIETPANLKHLKKQSVIKGKNGIVTGYIKADGLADVIPSERERKRILICPHHTVWGWKTLNISNFLTYAELFVKLPEIFPDIDFVFRPHPLLFDNLKAHKIWTQRQIDDYMKRLLSHQNMVYDNSGDYYRQFVDSDAMIHDCGSFIGEYLYTEKPCCYMIKSKEETYNGLVPLGKMCMDQHYHAEKEQDIIDFINNVVIEGNDTLKEQRVEFVRNELKANYPHAAETLINAIKKEIKIK